ncbi:hypothetical protein Pint_10517 [Pistacia integerrima]|uniref:Uncharacterized protein n=1 Tax=Pistacia integerrima TaxID=434235 RepID=A0ACC0XP59_9ROSI|nr:hypothetical protein Pint_10517 [Pistacia integerrima]
MAAYLILLSLFLSSVFTLTSQNQHHEIAEAKLKIARLESVLEESLQKLNARSNYLKERDNLIDELAIKIQDLLSLLSNIKHDSSRTEERVAALEEEVRLLWAVSRQNNFDLHTLESKAQDAEDRLEEVTSQVEKMADIVNEQWIQVQHLEQALHMTEMRALNIQRKLRVTGCTFLKFVNDVSEKHLPKLLGILDSYFSGGGSTLRSYVSKAEQQFKRFFSGFKKFHHELQGVIRQEMEKNELTAALVNKELVFFVASALITLPILTAWMLLSSKLG